MQGAKVALVRLPCAVAAIWDLTLEACFIASHGFLAPIDPGSSPEILFFGSLADTLGPPEVLESTWSRFELMFSLVASFFGSFVTLCVSASVRFLGPIDPPDRTRSSMLKAERPQSGPILFKIVGHDVPHLSGWVAVGAQNLTHQHHRAYTLALKRQYGVHAT